MHTLKSIRPSDLEEALLILPFANVLQLLGYLDKWLKQGYEVELCMRVLLFTLRIYQVQISANRSLQVCAFKNELVCFLVQQS